jgi:hypothetical protein
MGSREDITAGRAGRPAGDRERSAAYDQTRERAVQVGGLAIAVLTVEDLEEAIAAGERALSAGPTLDPTLFRAAAGELEEQLRYLRVVHQFVAAVETFRPAEEVAVAHG